VGTTESEFICCEGEGKDNKLLMGCFLLVLFGFDVWLVSKNTRKMATSHTSFQAGSVFPQTNKQTNKKLIRETKKQNVYSSKTPSHEGF
jgi:hypothetical protein